MVGGASTDSGRNLVQCLDAKVLYSCSFVSYPSTTFFQGEILDLSTTYDVPEYRCNFVSYLSTTYDNASGHGG